MGIGSDNNLPRADILFSLQLMRNPLAHLGNLDPGLLCKLPEKGVIVAQLHSRARGGMVQEEDGSLRIADLLETHLQDFSGRQRSCSVLRIGQIDLDNSDLSRSYLFARMGTEYFFR
jgi:hypothetical protein